MSVINYNKNYVVCMKSDSRNYVKGEIMFRKEPVFHKSVCL